MKKVVEAQIFYLEMLRKRNLLHLAVQGKLPREIEESAKTIVAGRYQIPFNKKTFSFSVSADEKDECEQEVSAYLQHYRENQKQPYEAISKQKEPVFVGLKYLVYRGYFLGRIIKVIGTDIQKFGIPWTKNYGDKICEKYLYRIQRDMLPVSGTVYFCMLEDEQRPVLIHECEIGQKIRFQ